MGPQGRAPEHPQPSPSSRDYQRPQPSQSPREYPRPQPSQSPRDYGYAQSSQSSRDYPTQSSAQNPRDYVKTKIQEAMKTTGDPQRTVSSSQGDKRHLHPMDAQSSHGYPIIPAADSSGSVEHGGQQHFSAVSSPMREDLVSGSKQRSPRPSIQSQGSEEGGGGVSSAGDEAFPTATSSTGIIRPGPHPPGRNSPASAPDSYGHARSPRPSYQAPGTMPAESSTPGHPQRSPKGPGPEMLGEDGRPSSREAQASYPQRHHGQSPRASIDSSPSVTSHGHERMDVDENSADSSHSNRWSEGSRPGSRGGSGAGAAAYLTQEQLAAAQRVPTQQEMAEMEARVAQMQQRRGSPRPAPGGPQADSASSVAHADSSRYASHYSPASSTHSAGSGEVSTSRGSEGATSTGSPSVAPSHGYNQNYMYPTSGSTAASVQRGGSCSSTGSAGAGGVTPSRQNPNSPRDASPTPLLSSQYETLSDDES